MGPINVYLFGLWNYLCETNRLLNTPVFSVNLVHENEKKKREKGSKHCKVAKL